jgi:peptide/nickel transport system permease protein
VRYLARRLGLYVIAGWAAITINFIIPRLMPGNPAEALLVRFHGQLKPQALHSLEALFGIGHQGIIGQYFTYLGDLASGNLGVSYTYFPTSVASVISGTLPWTLVLIGVSTVISFVLGTLLGVVLAWNRGSWRDAVLPISTFLSSIPYFWFGLVMLLLFSEHAHVFPASGGFSADTTIGFSGSFISSAAYHAVLPALTIVAASIGGWILGMRNMVLTTMSEDYVLLAQAKGLSARRVMFMYAARNAILPSVANFAMSLGFVVSGAILTEVVFSYPGIGYVLFQAVSNEDYPLMQGIFLVITFAVLVANLLADVVYVSLDPRTRQEGRGA